MKKTLGTRLDWMTHTEELEIRTADKASFMSFMRKIYSLYFKREAYTNCLLRYCTKFYTVKALRAIQNTHIHTPTRKHTHTQQCSHTGTQHQCSLQMLRIGNSNTRTAESKQRPKIHKGISMTLTHHQFLKKQLSE